MKGSMREVITGIARERIGVLLNLAANDPDPYSKYASHYVRLARRISSHYKIAVDEKIRICRSCNAVLIPGRNSRVRIASSNRYVVYKCDRCGSEVHVHY